MKDIDTKDKILIRLRYMVNLSYQKSEEIINLVEDIEKLRTKILTTPLKPNIETKIKWDAKISKAYWALTLAKNPLTRMQISNLLSSPIPKRMNAHQKEIIGYVKAINYIENNWTGETKEITTDEVLKLYDLSCKDVFGSTSSYYKSKELEVEKIINFIEKGKDHPLIQSGLMQIEIIKLSPFENATGRVARLITNLILAKHGYDLRNMLVIEDYYREDLVSLKEAIDSTRKTNNATNWLKYFLVGIKKSTEKALKTIEEQKINKTTISLWKLNKRQKEILEKITNPNSKVTNKMVQKMFNISQITASRDLSKMVSLGVLLPHGKGRSVFYTR